jgi:hypothetical protein
MGTARFSTKPLEFIGCTAGAVALGDADHIAWAQCSARTGEGVMRTCYTEHAGLVEAVHSITVYSYVSFAWNADGLCERIQTHTKSLYIP